MIRHHGLPGGAFLTLPSPVVSFGVYDGVHLGHQAVLGELVAWAKSLGGTAVVMTFDRHPQSVLRGTRVPNILSMEHRLLQIERAGADVCIVLPFSLEMAAMTPEQFLDRFLAAELNARGLILGFDQRFGSGAAGDFPRAKAWGDAHAVEVRRGPEIVRAAAKVSSTAIRAAISSGRLDDAAAMLGRPVSLYGTVVKGDGRGRRIGFPTANLDLHHELVPPQGVYLAHVTLATVTHRAVVNIGTRPTFGNGRAETVEAYVIGFAGDLYGRDLELVLVRKIRDEKKFESAEALVAQIRKDVVEAERG